MIFVGDDWAGASRCVSLRRAGNRLGKARLPEGIEGIGRFNELIAGHAGEPADVVVGIETDRGLWVQALVEAGLSGVPRSTLGRRRATGTATPCPGRSRIRATPSCWRNWSAPTATTIGPWPVTATWAKGSGPGPGPSEPDLGPDPGHEPAPLRPTRVLPGGARHVRRLADRDTLSVLAGGPGSRHRPKAHPGRVRTLLRNAGRQRNIEVRAHAIVEGLRAETLTGRRRSCPAFAATTRAQVALIAELNTQIAGLETELAAHFEQHPDADIYLPARNRCHPRRPGARRVRG